jgi:glycosyltransferase involved in cell wall biosynthesis
VSSSDIRPQVLYLLTDEISSVLVRGQLGHLVEEGFDVTVATRLAPAIDSDAVSTGGEQDSGDTWDPGVRVEHVPFVREPSPVADLRALGATVALIRRVRPTIVNASTPKAGLLGMLGAWVCRVPVRVYVVRGFRFETAVGWRRRLFRSLEWVAMRCANHVVFNSRSLLAVAERERLVPPGRGDVIGGGSGNGIDVARFADDALPTRRHARGEFGVPDGAIVVGFVGRFTRDKGIADLIGAFTSTLRGRDDVWLLLVGQFEDGDPVAPEVRRVIESDDRIVTVPWLADPGAAYRAMDVLAFPSYREGLPNVPLEAQLSGVPVVAYEATGTVDAVAAGVGGVLVPVGGVGEMATALGELLDDPERRTAVGAAGSAWVADRFDRAALWNGLVERYRSWSSSAGSG